MISMELKTLMGFRHIRPTMVRAKETKVKNREEELR